MLEALRRVRASCALLSPRLPTPQGRRIMGHWAAVDDFFDERCLRAALSPINVAFKA